jgi:hypothetical protein
MTSVMAKFLRELVILYWYVSYTLTRPIKFVKLAGFPSGIYPVNMTVASNNEFRIMIK